MAGDAIVQGLDDIGPSPAGLYVTIDELRSATETPVTVDLSYLNGVCPPNTSFATPSGNISCVMDAEFGVSCWIGDKMWEIDAPDGCTDDYGDDISLTTNGTSHGCYADVFWDLNAPTVSYGTTIEIGEFSCTIEQTGVTCTNGSARGFTLARAAVQRF